MRHKPGVRVNAIKVRRKKLAGAAASSGRSCEIGGREERRTNPGVSGAGGGEREKLPVPRGCVSPSERSGSLGFYWDSSGARWPTRKNNGRA